MNHRAGVSALVALLAGCGARTGLRQDHDAGPLPDLPDVAPPPARCVENALRAQRGATVPLEISLENVPTPYPEGFSWRVVQRPAGGAATPRASTSARSEIVPDRDGPWRIEVSTPFADGAGSALRCPIELVVVPPDPRCPGFALVTPRVLAIEGAGLDLAVDARWSPARSGSSAGRDTAVLATEDIDAQVAAFSARLPRMAGELSSVAAEVERVVASSVGATPVLVGRTLASTAVGTVRRSSFRVSASASTTAMVLRDRVAFELTAADPGRGALALPRGSEFTFELSTAIDPASGSVAVLFAAAEAGRAGDPTSGAASRIADFTDGSALGRRGSSLDVVCTDLVASRTVRADFLWLVDTSGSMDDDQERLGNAAQRFFQEMSSAGVDLRVGVVQAGSDVNGPDLDDPGFTWIRGDDPQGPRRLAHNVTFRRYRSERDDNDAPYPLAGGTEEPLAAAIVTARAMARRPPDPTAARSFRDDAQRVAFFVTDETGNNDDSRFFARQPAEWGTTFPARAERVARWFRDEGFLTFGMVNVFERAPCPTVSNFIPCVVTANGGGYLPLASSSEVEIALALSGIVDAVAGAASEFSLGTAAIASTVQAQVDGRAVPRSRANGFDYDPSAHSIVFRGGGYRPRRGQRVGIAAYRWR